MRHHGFSRSSLYKVTSEQALRNLLIDDGIPPHADLTAITQDMPISCRDNEFDTFIDHMVFDARAIVWVERSSFRHMTYRQGDKAVWGQISDHCPVIVEMWIE